ncbi:MAG: glycosyltransferase family 4 protein [Burkholderiales bacterium]|nr:glycosyltransferase family 4 protein [Burkholderiales bacterium]
MRQLRFIYYDLPAWASWWKRGSFGVHLYYALWQRAILPIARSAHHTHGFHVVHHLTFGVWRQPAHLYRLGIPMVFGPVGGGETAPWSLLLDLPSYADRFKELLRTAWNVAACFNPAVRRCLRSAAFVVAKTSDTARLIERTGAECFQSIEIGIESVNGRTLALEPSRGTLRCIYAGRLLGWKGVHLALRAIAMARAANVNATLTVVGRGPRSRPLRRMARELGLDNHVRFIDWIDQPSLFQEFRRHDLFLFPSLHDSSGNVILESFLNGLPVVALKLGGPGVLVTESCGKLIAVCRTSKREHVTGALVSELAALARDPERLTALRAGAIRRANDMSWSAAVARVYERVEAAHIDAGR